MPGETEAVSDILMQYEALSAVRPGNDGPVDPTVTTELPGGEP